MNTKAWTWTGLLIATLVGAWLRAAPVQDRPLWYDEADTWAATVDGAVKPLPYISFLHWENHFETAPLSFLLVRTATDLQGDASENTMRLPSLIFGVLCIPAMFLLGRIVQGNTLGLVAAALAAFDPNLVDQSQQARMYMVMMLFSMIAITWSIKLLRNPQSAPSDDRLNRNAWHWIGLGVVFGLLFSTQQFAAAVWIGIALGVVAIVFGGMLIGQPHAKPWQVLSGFTSAFVVGLIVAHIGVFKLLERVMHGGEGDGAGMTFMAITREIATAAKDLIGLGPAGLLVYPLALVGLVLLAKRCKTSVAVLVGVAAVNVLMLYPFRKMHHFLDARYLSLIQPTLFIGLGMLVIGFQQRTWRIGGIAAVVSLMAAQLWVSTHLTAYYMQPDRYLFAPKIMDVREQLKTNPTETALIHPGPAYILAKYYDLPQNKMLYEGFYDPMTTQPKPDGRMPASFDAPAVWLIMGMNNYPGRIEKAEAMLKQVTDHYGTSFDAGEMHKHLALNRVAVARVSREGVTFSSLGVDE